MSQSNAQFLNSVVQFMQKTGAAIDKQKAPIGVARTTETQTGATAPQRAATQSAPKPTVRQSQTATAGTASPETFKTQRPLTVTSPVRVQTPAGPKPQEIAAANLQTGASASAAVQNPYRDVGVSSVIAATPKMRAPPQKALSVAPPVSWTPREVAIQEKTPLGRSNTMLEASPVRSLGPRSEQFEENTIAPNFQKTESGRMFCEKVLRFLQKQGAIPTLQQPVPPIPPQPPSPKPPTQSSTAAPVGAIPGEASPAAQKPGPVKVSMEAPAGTPEATALTSNFSPAGQKPTLPGMPKMARDNFRRLPPLLKRADDGDAFLSSRSSTGKASAGRAAIKAETAPKPLADTKAAPLWNLRRLGKQYASLLNPGTPAQTPAPRPAAQQAFAAIPPRAVPAS